MSQAIYTWCCCVLSWFHTVYLYPHHSHWHWGIMWLPEYQWVTLTNMGKVVHNVTFRTNGAITAQNHDNDNLQSSAVITWSNMAWYGMHHYSDWDRVQNEGILPKGPYLPCLHMAGRALLAGYPQNQSLNPQNTSHILPSQVSYGMYFVKIFKEIDHVMMALHCINI